MATPKQGYTTKDGRRVPGTTTIIGRFKDSGGLLHWAFAQGRAAERGEIQALYDKRDEAGSLGTQAHEAIEAHLRGQPVDLAGKDPRVSQAFDNALRWLSSTRIEIVPELQEIPLVCDDYEFGGTPDAIGVLDGKLVLLDWKTSNSVHSDYIIQMAAYRHLLCRGTRLDTREPLGLDLEPGAWILRFSKDRADFAAHFFGDLDDAWEQFVLFRRAYELDKSLKKRAA